jgi:hypothetical protein
MPLVEINRLYSCLMYFLYIKQLWARGITGPAREEEEGIASRQSSAAEKHNLYNKLCN